MKYAIAAVVLVPLAIFGYSIRAKNVRANEAWSMYQRFAAAFHHDRIAECRSISDGAAMKAVVDAREKRHLELAKAGATDAATSTVVSTDYEKSSQAASGDDITFDAVMTIRHTPAGMVAARNIPQTKYRHAVTLRFMNGGWKVVAFQESEIP